MRSRVPWISLVLVALVLLNPVGIDFVRSAFFASEQLSRNIAQPIVVSALIAAAVVCLLEWAGRRYLIKRRVLRSAVQ